MNRKLRDGWEEAFTKAADIQTDAIIEIPLSEWDEDEWEW